MSETVVQVGIHTPDGHITAEEWSTMNLYVWRAFNQTGYGGPEFLYEEQIRLVRFFWAAEKV